MKTLYLIRHAKSSWDDITVNDFDRKLNERGKLSTQVMADVFNKLLIVPDIIITSPAKRAYSTAKRIAEGISYSLDKIVQLPEIYEAGIKELLHVVNNIDDQFQEAFLIGHNPGLTDFSNYLCGANIINMPTCSVVQITFPYNSWKLISSDTGDLKLFDFPRNHAQF